MSSEYELMDSDRLQRIYDEKRNQLGDLQFQEAKFGSLFVPVHIISQIRELKAQLADIKAEMDRRKSPVPITPPPTPQVDNAIAPPVKPQAVDVVIITALEEERRHVLKHFPQKQRLSLDDGVNVYYQTSMTSDGPNPRTYQIIVLSLIGMGQLNAANATSDAIRHWNPKCVLLIGIAGGAGDDVSLGDVLVSDQIVDYEWQKLTSDGPQVRYRTHSVAAHWHAVALNMDDDEWLPLIHADRPEAGQPRRHIGTILTGDKVMADGEVVKRYKDDWPRLIGVEMEAAGVASAAFQQAQARNFFMVRGVSDLANQDKNTPRVKGWREYACAAAAAYAVGMLKSGLLPAASA
jgi:nucleoside phosphorylase